MFMAKNKIDTYFAICIGFFLLFKEVFFHSYQFPDPNYLAGSGSKQTIQSSYIILWTVQKMTIFELFYIFASSFNVFVKGYSW